MYNPIDITYIREKLTNTQPPIQLYYFETIDSTNRFLKAIETIEPDTWMCCIANEQTAGRGRFGKTWISPKGVNIYCSVGFHLPSTHENLAGISLVTGLSILATLASYMPTEDLYVKWPNDVLYQHRKLCGILIEQNLNHLIIGIGINVNTVFQDPPPLEKPWGSIYELTGRFLNRNILLIDLLIKLTSYLQRFWTHGLSNFMHEWQQADYLMNKKIRMSIQKKETIGFSRGITKTGQLIFEDLQGEMHYLTSGNASLLTFL